MVVSFVFAETHRGVAGGTKRDQEQDGGEGEGSVSSMALCKPQVAFWVGAAPPAVRCEGGVSQQAVYRCFGALFL